VARTVVQGLLTRPLDRSLVLNINVPNLPYEKLRGLRVARLGHRHRSAPALPALDPKGRKVYWVGPSGAGADAGDGTDFHAVEQGYAAITPLTADLTRHASLPELRDWVSAL
jgi:5'-nucleotidase